LAILILGGFGSSGNKHILNSPSLWERRARNKGLVILKEEQGESYKENNAKDKKKANKDSKHTAGKGCSESKYLAAKSAIL
jgi:hypothetical protein